MYHDVHMSTLIERRSKRGGERRRGRERGKDRGREEEGGEGKGRRRKKEEGGILASAFQMKVLNSS